MKGIKDPNVTSNITSLDPNIACKGEKRMSKLKLEMLILSQCVAYVSLEELAKRVNRNPLYLKNFIIPDMIDKGLIERLYPLSPRHPDQKYREKKDK
ncbi:MAG: hypothetical protein LKK19_00940 [Bacteroidales bacterium]|nr:hypothetical protein [Bacteroidales bacterium]MCI2121252.1 hypothetical protein [Bacteroidales bacterium]MCI2146152.1 hypothetical protein [Bacteroidales bacterium]